MTDLKTLLPLMLLGIPVTVRPQSASVMIVGVAHLVARHDVHNAVFEDDPLSAKRQAEVAQIIDRLARFQPTAVLVEEDAGDTAIRAQYHRYLAGQFTLPANEIYQFGFKLAARAGNKDIYPIDSDGPSLIDDHSDSGKAQVEVLKTRFAGVSTPSFATFLARSDTLERHGTYLDLLRYLNTEAAIRANASFYSVVDTVGHRTYNAGAAYVSQWYGRNCYIFANMLSAIAPGARVVVFIGQGHEYLLDQLVRLNPTLASIDPLTYLGE